MAKTKSIRKARWWHKWGGLFMTFFLLMFALSGILLNHRRAISTLDIPRSVLPSAYHYHNWNNGAVRGATLIGTDSVLLYGSNGIWLTDSLHRDYRSFVDGMTTGADNRYISNIALSRGGEVFTASTFDLYQLDRSRGRWQRKTDLLQTEERITDVVARGDSIVVQTRSELFVSTPPYQRFDRIELVAPKGYVSHTGLMRTIWTLHSGELFGLVGQLVVDALGIVIILLCLTGLVISFFPRLILRRRKVGLETPKSKRIFTRALNLHNHIGTWCILGLLLLAITGTFLRPPLLVPIVKIQHTPLPLTHQDSPNPWFDKLRLIRYDQRRDRWIIYTADGFYQTSDLSKPLRPISVPPPTGFMGPTVMEQLSEDEWITGSFAGLFRWNSQTGRSYDLYRHQWYDPALAPKIPDFKYSVSGYTSVFGGRAITFDYNRGAETTEGDSILIPQPQIFEEGRMSLWHTALETHVGRIYTFLPKIVVTLFIFLSGTFLTVVLISGYIVYRKFHRRRPHTPNPRTGADE